MEKVDMKTSTPMSDTVREVADFESKIKDLAKEVITSPFVSLCGAAIHILSWIEYTEQMDSKPSPVALLKLKRSLENFLKSCIETIELTKN